MKEFEKWNDNFEGEPPDRIEPGLDCYECVGYYKREAWKAALEWALGINSIYSDCNRKCFTLQDIEREIDA
ncbi:hypothetical protein LCGC14_2462430 [marine sediment metagenome]|uniref:Uncharacterized protein n=1 Tax=marine sediment metagenome TaxID=412755 RepID=A0A0F9BCW8_9ZZZZ